MVLLNLLVEASTIKVILGQKRVRPLAQMNEFRIKISMEIDIMTPHKEADLQSIVG